jgi:hypothetical protein
VPRFRAPAVLFLFVDGALTLTKSALVKFGNWDLSIVNQGRKRAMNDAPTYVVEV